MTECMTIMIVSDFINIIATCRKFVVALHFAVRLLLCLVAENQ